MSIPKNYITSGISKNFLTPCRRIGLSRSKKTPKNIDAGSPVPALNIPINTPSPDVQKKSKELEVTPKKLPSPKLAKDVKQVSVKSILENEKAVNDSSDGPKITKTKLNSDTLFIKENKTVSLKNEKRGTLDSPNQKFPVTCETVALHCPVAKRSIDFNITDEYSSIPTIKEKEVILSGKISAVLGKTSPCLNNTENNSLKNFKKDSCKGTVMKNKKRRLRSNSDYFVSSNEDLPETKKDFLENSISPKRSKFKNSLSTVNESNNGVILGRFTTEDYLKEYSTNPEKFKENLEGENPIITTMTGDNEDMEVFSNFPNNIKRTKNKSEDTTKNVSTSNKKYVAVVCPNIDQSDDSIKPKRSLSTTKCSLQENKYSLKQSVKVSTATDLKQKLTVTLQHLTKEELKRYSNKDLQLEKLPSTLGMTEPTKTFLNVNNFNEDDDELFISSPENDKKQRENLLQLILNTENEVKQKQEKLEKLKQAQVYKKKHSPAKLKISADKWLEGCRASLNDLLLKMQEHGPMEMDTLISKLRIPNDVLEKIKV